MNYLVLSMPPSPAIRYKAWMFGYLIIMHMLVVISAGLVAQEKPAPIPVFGGSGKVAEPVFQEHRFTSFYLPMSDGVSLALDLVLPGDSTLSEPVPALVEITRRWRGLSGKQFPADRISLVNHGYAFLRVDARGTGASGGVRKAPCTARALADCVELLAWLKDREWFNGRLGGLGFYADAKEVELLAHAGRPELRALALVYGDHDLFGDCLFPGGVQQTAGLQAWSAQVRQFDQGKWPFPIDGSTHLIRPVDEDVDLEELELALVGHQGNRTLSQLSELISGREDFALLIPHADATQLASLPLFLWGGWRDGGSAAGVLRRFSAATGPVRAVIEDGCRRGPVQGEDVDWSGENGAGSFPRPGWRELMRFFDIHVKGYGGGVKSGQSLLFQMGDGKGWVGTRAWPPAGGKRHALFLHASGKMEATSPATSGLIKAKADYRATTGRRSRWWARTFTRKVKVEPRGSHLFSFTSPPLEKATMLAGTPMVTLRLASTASDGAFFAYLEEVSPGGQVKLLTEGMLRACFRTRLKDSAGFGRCHSFKRADRTPLVPGKQTLVEFPLLPLARRVARGARLRLGLECHDFDNFVRVPKKGVPEITIFCGGKGVSALVIQIMK